MLRRRGANETIATAKNVITILWSVGWERRSLSSKAQFRAPYGPPQLHAVT